MANIFKKIQNKIYGNRYTLKSISPILASNIANYH